MPDRQMVAGRTDGEKIPRSGAVCSRYSEVGANYTPLLQTILNNDDANDSSNDWQPTERTMGLSTKWMIQRDTPSLYQTSTTGSGG